MLEIVVVPVTVKVLPPIKVRLEEVARGEVPAPKRMSLEVTALLPVPPLATPKTPEVIAEAGRAGVLLAAAVILPWASTVKEGIWVVEPKVPTLLLATFRPKTPEAEIVASPDMVCQEGAAAVWPKRSWPLEPTAVVVAIGPEPLPSKTVYWVFKALPVPPLATPIIPEIPMVEVPVTEMLVPLVNKVFISA
jgi:hypothetical protein